MIQRPALKLRRAERGGARNLQVVREAKSEMTNSKASAPERRFVAKGELLMAKRHANSVP